MRKPKGRRIAALNMVSHLTLAELWALRWKADSEPCFETIVEYARDRVAQRRSVKNNPPTTRKRDRPKCGARTRAGGKCQAPAVWDKKNNKPRNGRCRLHGGLSTGPKTPEGKARSLAQLKRN